MLLLELGYIFLYIAGFGFSDFIVKHAELSDTFLVLYYLMIAIIGIKLVKTYHIIENKNENKNNNENNNNENVS